MTFAELLVDRLAAMNATQADLARWLSGRGIETTRQAVSDWCDGTSRPLAWKWKTLFHVLGVTVADQKRWRDALEAKSIRPALAPDGTVNTDGHPGARGLDPEVHDLATGEPPADVVLTEVPFTLSDHDSPHDGADSDAA